MVVHTITLAEKILMVKNARKLVSECELNSSVRPVRACLRRLPMGEKAKLYNSLFQLCNNQGGTANDSSLFLGAFFLFFQLMEV
ncbi:hypothetical protein FHS14_000475 [Paenibacillus baekrokdamisoli]|nr:hypothetical protein [Paenibacillus baekrokdamisoli]